MTINEALPKPECANIWGGAYTAEQMRSYAATAAAVAVAAERKIIKAQLMEMDGNERLHNYYGCATLILFGADR